MNQVHLNPQDTFKKTTKIPKIFLKKPTKMEKILKPLILLVFLVSSQLVISQLTAQKRGDYFFGQFSYAKAIPFYQEMIEKDFNTSHAHQQLAECYLLIRDFKKAMPHFEAIINEAGIPSDYYFKYAMALHSSGTVSYTHLTLPTICSV